MINKLKRNASSREVVNSSSSCPLVVNSSMKRSALSSVRNLSHRRPTYGLEKALYLIVAQLFFAPLYRAPAIFCRFVYNAAVGMATFEARGAWQRAAYNEQYHMSCLGMVLKRAKCCRPAGVIWHGVSYRVPITRYDHGVPCGHQYGDNGLT